MLSSNLLNRETYDVNIEEIIKREFDLAMEDAEFMISGSKFDYYIYMNCAESISKISLTLKILTKKGRLLSTRQLYITMGHYYIEVNNLKIFIQIDGLMKGYVGNVENTD